jgi:predicted  nucleic acid-binding Zn-ribbon protein
MEVVGLVGGLITICEAGGKISQSLYNLGHTLVKAKDQINELARELSNVSAAFGSLADVLGPCKGLVKQALLDNTQAILDACKSTYAEIEETVSLVERQSLKARERSKWPFRKAKVKQLKSRLESAKATLDLMVNIMHLSATIKFLESVTATCPSVWHYAILEFS